MGENLFVLIGVFGVGQHRLRSLGLSEYTIRYFLAWNAQTSLRGSRTALLLGFHRSLTGIGGIRLGARWREASR